MFNLSASGVGGDALLAVDTRFVGSISAASRCPRDTACRFRHLLVVGVDALNACDPEGCTHRFRFVTGPGVQCVADGTNHGLATGPCCF